MGTEAMRTYLQPSSLSSSTRASSSETGEGSTTPNSFWRSTNTRISSSRRGLERSTGRTTSSKPVPFRASRMPCWWLTVCWGLGLS